MKRNENFEGAVLEREVERILPLLMRSLWGNGSLSLDTDTMSLTNDYRTLEWLSRVVAGFVSEERSLWQPNMKMLQKDSDYAQKRMRKLDNLLGKLKELSDDEEATVESYRSLMDTYLDPMDYYLESLKPNPALAFLRDNLKKDDRPDNSNEDSSTEEVK